MATYTDGTRTWNSQYYADMNSPCGFYNLASLSTLTNVPDESKLFALTAEQWASRIVNGTMKPKVVTNNTFVDYVAPTTTTTTGA